MIAKSGVTKLNTSTVANKPTVIHFTEAGGGVLTSISQIISLTPSLNHIVFARSRDNFSDFKLINQCNAQVIQWENTLLIGMLKLAILKKKNSGAIVHLHSSKCGVARFLPNISRAIYSPHCFSYERKDIGLIIKKFYEVIEFIAARRTALTICVSQRELNLALKLNKKANALIHEHVVDEWRAKKPNKLITAIGRICAQKNPELFVEIVNNLRFIHSDLTVRWIGDGDQKMRQLLLDNGIEVSGWQDAAKVQELLSDGSVLLHCALWEGMPVVFFEALAGGIPVVVKRENYLDGNNRFLTFDSVQEAVEICSNLILNQTRNDIHSVDQKHASEILSSAYAQIRQMETKSR